MWIIHGARAGLFAVYLVRARVQSTGCRARRLGRGGAETLPEEPFEALQATVSAIGLRAADVGRYQANAWGLHDMHGNVAEWTRSAYRPYPLDAKAQEDLSQKKVVRGGSWYDRPKEVRSAYRLPYQRWQRVFDVGFRVALEVE